jgi:hypothetical protein
VTPSLRIEVLANLVREEAELYVNRYGCGPALEGWCMVVSAALTLVFCDAGISAAMAGGWFCVGDLVEGHRWVLVEPPFAVPPEQSEAYATLIDLTATQFAELIALTNTPFTEADLSPVLILGPGDRRRAMYALEKIGLDECLAGMPPNDVLHLEILAARCICASRSIGAGTSLRAPTARPAPGTERDHAVKNVPGLEEIMDLTIIKRIEGVTASAPGSHREDGAPREIWVNPRAK